MVSIHFSLQAIQFLVIKVIKVIQFSPKILIRNPPDCLFYETEFLIILY